jgi:hypothetical protein
MSEPSTAPRASVVGYAVGFGAAFAALVGTVLHFAFPDVPDVISLGGSFLVGAVVGGLWARARRIDLHDPDR